MMYDMRLAASEVKIETLEEKKSSVVCRLHAVIGLVSLSFMAHLVVAHFYWTHVKAASPQASISSSSNSQLHLVSDPNQVGHSFRISSATDTSSVLANPVELSALSKPFFPLEKQAWNQDSEDYAISEDGNRDDFKSLSPSEQPICAFAAAGKCPHGESCPHIHGDLCSTCGKHCLHPYRPEERDEHIRLCQINNRRLEALGHSQEIECSVCLDRVLSKATPAERKFGLLSECDHPFCISRIRNWRSNSPSSCMDVNNTLRACPICRKLSYFVNPSVIWYSSKEEKQERVNNYKAKLRSIDCRCFDFGNGTCPFGSSCLYKDAYHDGHWEEVKLRHLGAEDGNTVIVKDIRLSDFFNRLNL